MRRPPRGAPRPAAVAVEITADVTAMGAQGDGVCRTADGQTVFAPFVLPGETARLSVSGGRGDIVELLEKSSERVEPPCPHFEACGGCALQHWAHAPYLEWKADVIRGALSREGLEAEFLTPFAARARTDEVERGWAIRRGGPGAWWRSMFVR